jgi:hypothetical protein
MVLKKIEKTFIEKIGIPTIITDKHRCLICHVEKLCIHLSCNLEHCYCVNDFVNWYQNNEKKCCLCMKPFKIEECNFG